MSLRPAATSSVVDTGRASTWSESSDDSFVFIVSPLNYSPDCAREINRPLPQAVLTSRHLAAHCGQEVQHPKRAARLGTPLRAPRKTKNRPPILHSEGTLAGWKPLSSSYVFNSRQPIARPSPRIESGP